MKHIVFSKNEKSTVLSKRKGDIFPEAPLYFCTLGENPIKSLNASFKRSSTAVEIFRSSFPGLLWGINLVCFLSTPAYLATEFATRLCFRYRQKYLEPCECLMACNMTVYSTYVQSRKEVAMPESNLSLYFSSNLVTVMDEVLGYDWNNFLSDLGGSLGFLLGLSVIGALSLVEHIFQLLFDNRFCKGTKATEGNGGDEKENENVSEEARAECKNEEKKQLQNNERNYRNIGEYYNNINKEKNEHIVAEKY